MNLVVLTSFNDVLELGRYDMQMVDITKIIKVWLFRYNLDMRDYEDGDMPDNEISIPCPIFQSERKRS